MTELAYNREYILQSALDARMGGRCHSECEFTPIKVSGQKGKPVAQRGNQIVSSCLRWQPDTREGKRMGADPPSMEGRCRKREGSREPHASKTLWMRTLFGPLGSRQSQCGSSVRERDAVGCGVKRELSYRDGAGCYQPSSSFAAQIAKAVKSIPQPTAPQGSKSVKRHHQKSLFYLGQSGKLLQASSGLAV